MWIRQAERDAFGYTAGNMAKRILVVDDDADFREIFSTHLRMLGYDLDVANGATEGLAKIRAQAPDLVLMDVQMPPGISGIDAFFELKADPKTASVPVLFLTNLGASETVEAAAQQVNEQYAQELGAVGVLKKTDELVSLSDRIARYFAEAAPR